MNCRSLAQKLCSTKLWCALAGIATGIAIALGVDSGDVQSIAGAMTSAISAVSYIISEAKIDTKSLETGIKIGDINQTGNGDV